MFIKPFRIKSNITVKGTDRKKIRGECVTNFPRLSLDQINQLIPMKGNLQVNKIVTHGSLVYQVYTMDGVPILFRNENILYPTIFTMWRYPDMLLSLIISTGVIEFAKRGSDIMTPGIIKNAFEYEFKKFRADELISISTLGDGSSVLIGFTLMDSTQMLEENKGHGVKVLHVIDDYLWTMDKIPETPKLPCLSLMNLKSLVISEEPKDDSDTSHIEGEDESDMDYIFERCFLNAAKSSIQKSDLPLLVSNLKSHMSKYCPSEISLDVKKSSFKKMSVFLSKMMEHGVIDISSENGVDSIVKISKNCKYFKEFDIVYEPENNESTSEHLTIEEYYTLKKKTIPVFIAVDKTVDYRTKFDLKQISQIVRHYVAEISENKMIYGNVTLDAKLTDASKTGKSLPESVQRVDTIINSIVEHGMSRCSIIKYGERQKCVNGSPKSVELTIVIKKGNKKVTTIQNLDQYFIDENEIAYKVKMAMSCSTSVVQCEGNSKRCYVVVQGNQIKYICKILIDDYYVPKRFITGMEKQLKK